MHLFFDLDGTLTDPFVGITRCIQHALAVIGRPAPAPDSLRWCIGPPLHDSLATLLGPAHAHLAGEALAVYRERFGTVGLFENEMYPEIPAVLAALRDEGHTLHVATSKPQVFAARIIDHFGLGPHFHCVGGSELDGTRTDKAALVAHLLEVHGLAPGDVLMVGDREHDVRGAAANGVPCVGVLWGYGSRDELETAGASLCVAAPRQLVSAVSSATARAGYV